MFKSKRVPGLQTPAALAAANTLASKASVHMGMKRTVEPRLPSTRLTQEERAHIHGEATGKSLGNTLGSSTGDWDPVEYFNNTAAHPEDFTWMPQPKQALMLERTEHEIYYGGARFGGKTAGQVMWLSLLAIERLNGRIRYPNYYGLVARRQYADLKGWLIEATPFYKRLGAKAVGNPVEFRFQGGPVVASGHLEGETGFEKYQGAQIHKLGLDEVNQISNETIYKKLLGSVRMSPDGYSQVLGTGNPGGPGDHWIKPRFVYVYSGGVMIPWGTPFLDPVSGKSRIFIQAFPHDNKIGLAQDPEYLGVLAGMDDVTRAQWLEGSWDATQAAFFHSFRPQRYSSEPEHYLHCVHSDTVKLLPGYRRWISMDWGYNDLCCVYWHVQHEDERIYTYREMVTRKKSAYDVGQQIAMLSYDDLSNQPDQSMELYLSPDAFNTKDGTHDIADRIKMGIENVLGVGTSTILSMTHEEKLLAETDSISAQRAFLDRVIGTLANSGITVRPANNKRALGWSFMQEMLECQPTTALPGIQDLMAQIAAKGGTSEAALNLVAKYNAQYKSESTLPKWRIFSDKCPVLIKTIPLAQRDPTRPDDVIAFTGDDPLDAARYGLMAYRTMPAELPKEFVIQRMIDTYKERCQKQGLEPSIQAMKMIWQYNFARRNAIVSRSSPQIDSPLELLGDGDGESTGMVAFGSPFGGDPGDE